jgi:hypothetical protein
MTNRPPDEVSALVILQVGEARLVVHALAAFERLLRHGELSAAQARLLLPIGAGPDDPQADEIMAEIVSECGEPLRRQLP